MKVKVFAALSLKTESNIKRNFMLFAALLLIVTGCGKRSQVGSVSSPGGLPNAEFGIKYAGVNFNINYLENGVKLVTDSEGNKLLLVPKGVTVPQGYDSAVLVETPIGRAMYTVTTFVGFLGALEDDALYDSVAVVCTPEEDWTTPQVLARFRSCITRYVEHGYTTVGNIEDIVGTRPEFVFTGGDDSDMRLRSMLDEFGVKHATLQGREEGDAANLEWIKFFAAFFNLDEEAHRIFEAKHAYLNELYQRTANIRDKPAVAYGLIWNGVVYTQSGTSTLARQIENAGGVYTLKELGGSGSVLLTIEEFFNRCRNADIVLYGSSPRYCPDKAYLLETEPLMAEFNAFKNDRIYIFDKGYYMNSARVVEKFEDMVFMLHPELLPGHELTMYQKLPD